MGRWASDTRAQPLIVLIIGGACAFKLMASSRCGRRFGGGRGQLQHLPVTQMGVGVRATGGAHAMLYDIFCARLGTSPVHGAPCSIIWRQCLPRGMRGPCLSRLLHALPFPQHVGRFKDPEEAARAYDRAAVHLHGMEVVTNFPAEEALANGTPMAKPLRLLLERFKDRLQIPLPPSICGSEDSAVTTMGGGRSRGGSPSRGKRGAGLAGAPPSRREPSKRGRQSAELSSKSWSGAAGLPDAASLQQQHVGMPPHPHQQQLQRQLLQRCSSAPAAVQAGLRTLMQGAGGNASVLGAHNLAQFEW